MLPEAALHYPGVYLSWKEKNMILLLLTLVGLQPFNMYCDYTGDQDGKGSTLTSFGCITAGNTELDASGNLQILVAAYNESGGFLWTDSFYWGQGAEIIAVQEWSDGIIFTGSWGDPSTAGNALAYAVSPDCQPMWTYSLELNGVERFNTAAEGTDGTIVCAGSTNSIGAGGNDILMVALDQTGNLLWTKTYGTEGEEAAYHISACDDGGYILAGQAMNWGAGNGDYWIVRTDSKGDTLWTGTYGGPEFEYPWRVEQCSDGFYVAGSSLSYGNGSYDWWILKLDPDGNLIWNTAWGFQGTDSAMALSVRNDRAVVGGSSEPALNDFAATAVVFDENGNAVEEWFYDPGIIRSIDTLDGGGFLMGGSTYFAGNGDLSVICTDSLGNCPEMGILPSQFQPSLVLSHNPVSSSVGITVLNGSSIVTVLDLYGRIAGTAEVSNQQAVFDVSELPSGIYSVYSGNGKAVRMAVIR
jgi:hypothetical protein